MTLRQQRPNWTRAQPSSRSRRLPAVLHREQTGVREAGAVDELRRGRPVPAALLRPGHHRRPGRAGGQGSQGRPVHPSPRRPAADVRPTCGRPARRPADVRRCARGDGHPLPGLGDLDQPGQRTTGSTCTWTPTAPGSTVGTRSRCGCSAGSSPTGSSSPSGRPTAPPCPSAGRCGSCPNAPDASSPTATAAAASPAAPPPASPRSTTCTPWADGGTTDLNNQITLCTAHHDGIDRGDHTITGDPTRPDGLVVTNRYGLPIRPPRPSRHRTTHPAATPNHRPAPTSHPPADPSPGPTSSSHPTPTSVSDASPSCPTRPGTRGPARSIVRT